MKQRSKIRPIAVHLVRTGIVLALLWLIPSPRPKNLVNGSADGGIDLALVQESLPAAASVSPESDADGFYVVTDSQGKPIARALRTLPEAGDVIGYRGPSESLILLDDQLRVLGVRLIESVDTKEHVDAVLASKPFFDQFRRWSWGGPPEGVRIDGVSGATLTSLALAKGVLKRIGGNRPSLVFPDPVSVDEISRWFPNATAVSETEEVIDVTGNDGRVLGRVVRTGPLVDGIVGYQGPTELLIRTEQETPEAVPAVKEKATRTERIADVRIRRSYDNEPYVGYCRTEYSFWSLFKGRSIDELASMDLRAERVEGVSGATMSSMAIAETLVASAAAYQDRKEQRRIASETRVTLWTRLRDAVKGASDVRIGRSDVACLLLLAAVPVFRRRGWFRRKRLRWAWLFVAVLVIGVWSGNLISMALLAGWSAEGIAWRIAPALAAIAVVAFVSPVVGKSNPYCSHLCPHGAIQQLVRPEARSRRHWRMPKTVAVCLAWLPGSLLVLAYVLLIRIPATDLSSWEPFHAYLYRIAPWTALALAALTLAFSALVPMGYCRLGCPTGRLLDHLRRSASSDRLKWADGVAVGLLVFALLSAGGII